MNINDVLLDVHHPESVGAQLALYYDFLQLLHHVCSRPKDVFWAQLLLVHWASSVAPTAFIVKV